MHAACAQIKTGLVQRGQLDLVKNIVQYLVSRGFAWSSAACTLEMVQQGHAKVSRSNQHPELLICKAISHAPGKAHVDALQCELKNG